MDTEVDPDAASANRVTFLPELPNQPVVILTVTSLMSLTIAIALCLCCKRKNDTIHEENKIFDPQMCTNERTGSVVPSSVVSGLRGIISALPSTTGGFPSMMDDEEDMDGGIYANLPRDHPTPICQDPVYTNSEFLTQKRAK
ncbi:hypothetical protein J4Q44_G00333160 [Coregonus suidteri]|uniref:Uncharacterized protein n=1 Tax=Coregonus suidteri TaxID=861788 RepID=A0AAN8KQE9_9TELE